jgi:hypothetical protein
MAPFVEAAIAEQEAVAGMVGALVALTRAPRAGESVTDVGVVVAHVVRLLGPAVRHDGVRVDVVAPAQPARTAAPLLAVRLAVASTLELAAEAARNPGGAGDRSEVVRCTVLAESGPTLDVVPAPTAWRDDTQSVLATWEIQVTSGPEGCRLVFPAL